MAERGTRVWRDPQELEELIMEYFESRWDERRIISNERDKDGKRIELVEKYRRPPTMAGLALHLGVTRRTLLLYGRAEGTREDEFIPVITRAKEMIAEFAEEALYTREGVTGAQFSLRVNHGYGSDEDESGEGEAFHMNLIPPADRDTALAIPKWGEDDE